MKKTLFVAALLATTAAGGTTAYATNYNYLCTTDRCTPNLADFLQNLDGIQTAINLIVDIDDANTIVQEAVNAGNLVNIETDIDLANVEQNASVYQFASNLLDGDAWFFNSSDMTGVTQSATNVANSISSDSLVKAAKQTAGDAQMASNAVLGTYGSKLYDLQQAATNVVNTVTAGTSKTVNQYSTTDQVAVNVIYGGWGGYDADAVDWEDDVEDVSTQAAVNAANLVNLDSLTGAIKQTSYGSQDAINKAIFSGNVYDLGQSATNVANSVSVGSITPAVFDCLCYDGWEVNQLANVDQFAKNLLVTVGDVNNTIQSATNIANSINVATPTAP
ncbi:hypothetical protein IC608_14000 [Devosia sp. PTR5]|uniref:Uncharacterized protein n=1 Tax=Devosia oryzisoli TaxID=2774138 RepID=A0A927FWU2_9HYPH|nr:hypothetical protein [Devosia oryzisoli]MBD8066584.1 hypothetical protein [Devosia oryzisoli]